MRRSAVTAALLLASCHGGAEQPRLATVDESRAIFAREKDQWRSRPSEFASKYTFCISRKIYPALEDARRQAAARKRDWDWDRLLGFFWPDSDPQETDHAAKSWVKVDRGPEIEPVELQVGRDLELKLERAVKTKLSASELPAENVLPNDILKSADAPENLPCGKPENGIERHLSRPVIVGGIAFVEASSTCGLMCGSGSLRAYRRENSRWHWFATKRTWIA